MDLRIYEILRTGNVTSLQNLLLENEPIFDRFLTEFVSQNPLHIAIQHRSVDFAREILRRKPQLAYVLSSQGLSPLRMASANGSVDIVRELLPLIVDVSHDRDSKGWTPVHAAAMKGHVDVLNVFNETNPEWIRDITDRDETVLHLCVKYNKLDVLKMLIGLVGRDDELVNRKDVNGNTILHLAAMKKDMEMITYLSPETGVEINAMNMNGLTALDVFAPCSSNTADKDMVKELRKKGAERSWEMSTEKSDNQLKNVLILVGTLTATLSFQAALVPPGGLWQDDLNMGFNNTLNNKNSHTAGTSILADKEPKQFHTFQSFNLLVFFMSLFLILIGASPVKPVYREKVVSPMLQILLLALSFVSVMIYLCNNVHTPKGLPHDIGWELNASNLIFFACSLFICFLVSIFYLMTKCYWLRRQ
ncbi:ankyrin repeat-containing protein BDA1-like isoform X2 [Magnolia sinica]|uniref:ankyrin repeat-containing protein BDA1-like isoform X2 n=1 Tax=Magnolia sinica TaxID=86752 RepID=UPI00265B71C0|nr:ankyrin repeat-containing protein BDA1-like isoform X2 [Magnolia sinica]